MVPKQLTDVGPAVRTGTYIWETCWTGRLASMGVARRAGPLGMQLSAATNTQEAHARSGQGVLPVGRQGRGNGVPGALTPLSSATGASSHAMPCHAMPCHDMQDASAQPWCGARAAVAPNAASAARAVECQRQSQCRPGLWIPRRRRRRRRRRRCMAALAALWLQPGRQGKTGRAWRLPTLATHPAKPALYEGPTPSADACRPRWRGVRRASASASAGAGAGAGRGGGRGRVRCTRTLWDSPLVQQVPARHSAPVQHSSLCCRGPDGSAYSLSGGLHRRQRAQKTTAKISRPPVEARPGAQHYNSPAQPPSQLLLVLLFSSRHPRPPFSSSWPRLLSRRYSTAIQQRQGLPCSAPSPPSRLFSFPF